MKHPLVSIALPAKNAAKTLTATLESIRQQSFTNFELIVADDGSVDETRDLVLSVRDSRFHLISDGQSRGIAARLNQIAQQAKGNYFARMDADDLMHKDRLERQVQALQAAPQVDVLGTDAYTIDKSTNVIGYFRGVDPSRDPWKTACNGAFIHPTVAGKTEWFRRNPYSTQIDRAEDLDLWIRTCAKSTFATLHEPLLYYRLRESTDIKPLMASQKSADRLLLQTGRDCDRLLSAYAKVAVRRLKFAFYVASTKTGLRDIVRRAKGMKNEKLEHPGLTLA